MQLASVFTDGAVLQRRMSIPVWGKSSPQVWVKGELDGKSCYCKSSSTGDFCLHFPPQEAGGPYVLTVSEVESGECCSLSDVYVGEVWVASGQSNMQYALGSRWAKNNPDNNPSEAVSEAQEAEFRRHLEAGDYSNYHFLTVPQCASGAQELSQTAVWQAMTTDSTLASAVAAWFGLAVRDRLEVPVGLLISDWGGTLVEAWTSRGALRANPDTRQMIADYETRMSDEACMTYSYEEQESILVSKYATKDGENLGLKKGWAEVDFDDRDWVDMDIPNSWIQKELAGNGAVWIRLTVNLNADWQGQELCLNLGGIDKQDVTYVNGVEVGRTGKDFETCHWNAPRHYHVPAELVRPGKNVIAIRAYSFAYDGSFNGAESHYVLTTADQSQRLSLAQTWRFKAEKDLGRLRLPHLAMDVMGPGNPNTPSILFDGMICPLLPYAVRGAIWYQGETNAETIEESSTYASKLTAMIKDWRRQWEEPDFPFIQVELAGFRKPQAMERKSAWAVLREQQQLVAKDLDQSYIVSAVDRGEENNIHPQDKKTVGLRMSAVALKEVYGIADMVDSGPVLTSCLPGQSNRTLQLTFAHAEGLKLLEEPGSSFFLAGEDRRFYPADLFDLQGDTLVLGSSQVAEPVAVRYAWADNPRCILFNGEGWPASPFRTDAWEADTVTLG